MKTPKSNPNSERLSDMEALMSSSGESKFQYKDNVWKFLKLNDGYTLQMTGSPKIHLSNDGEMMVVEEGNHLTLAKAVLDESDFERYKSLIETGQNAGDEDFEAGLIVVAKDLLEAELDRYITTMFDSVYRDMFPGKKPMPAHMSAAYVDLRGHLTETARRASDVI